MQKFNLQGAACPPTPQSLRVSLVEAARKQDKQHGEQAGQQQEKPGAREPTPVRNPSC